MANWKHHNVADYADLACDSSATLGKCSRLVFFGAVIRIMMWKLQSLVDDVFLITVPVFSDYFHQLASEWPVSAHYTHYTQKITCQPLFFPSLCVFAVHTVRASELKHCIYCLGMKTSPFFSRLENCFPFSSMEFQQYILLYSQS